MGGVKKRGRLANPFGRLQPFEERQYCRRSKSARVLETPEQRSVKIAATFWQVHAAFYLELLSLVEALQISECRHLRVTGCAANFIAFLQKQFREISAVLARNPCHQCCSHAGSLLYSIKTSAPAADLAEPSAANEMADSAYN